MRFILKQKFWSFGDDFVIRDEQENECFRVIGEIFTIGDKLSLQDMAGNELAAIVQRLFSWGATYEIRRPGHDVSVISKEHFTFFSCKFEIDGPGRDDYEASGDFMDHEYQIQGAEGLAATVSKRWFSWTDTYGIEIVEGLDPVLLLASVVVIDLVCHADPPH
jgi:uncharacterized protein YxjI